jgi:hypothetical protein
MNDSTVHGVDETCATTPSHTHLVPVFLSLVQSVSAFTLKPSQAVTFHHYDDVIDQAQQFIDVLQTLRNSQYEIEQIEIAKLFSQVPVAGVGGLQ